MSEDPVGAKSLLLALGLGVAGMGFARLIPDHPWAAVPCLGCWCAALVSARFPLRWLASAAVLSLIVAGAAVAVDERDLASATLRGGMGLALLTLAMVVVVGLPAGLKTVRGRRRKPRITPAVRRIDPRATAASLSRGCSRAAVQLTAGVRSVLKVVRDWWRRAVGVTGLAIAMALCLGGSASAETPTALVALFTMVLGARLLTMTLHQLCAIAGGSMAMAAAAATVERTTIAGGLATATYLALITGVLVGCTASRHDGTTSASAVETVA